MPRIVIEYKSLCADYEAALTLAETMVRRYPGLRHSTWKFSSERPQRAAEQPPRRGSAGDRVPRRARTEKIL